MAYDIRNQGFRDMTAQARHPFLSTASITNGSIQLPDDFLLDAIIYIPGGVLPYYLQTLSYSDLTGVLRVGVADYTGVEKASAELSGSTSDHTHLRDSRGVVVGTLTHATDAPERIGALLGGASAEFTSAQAAFQTGVCFSSSSATGTHSFNINGVDYTSGPTLVARAGVVISQDGDGANRIDLYGEEDFRRHVRSVNGVAPTGYHMWLLPRHGIGHMTEGEANVRLSNDAGTLRVARASDFGYGDKVRSS